MLLPLNRVIYIHDKRTKESKNMANMEEAKKQTIGVEVEMNNITRKEAARLAAQYFGTGRYEDTARRNGYMTWSAWDGQGREWKFQRDISIAGPDSKKCEMVTPILTYADIETLQELIRVLRRAGAKSDATRGCGGTHPHRSQGPYSTYPQKPGEHHGFARKPDSRGARP